MLPRVDGGRGEKRGPLVGLLRVRLNANGLLLKYACVNFIFNKRYPEHA